jgi:hypothetical protein
MTISILKDEQFYPLGKPLPRADETKSVVDAVQVRPGIWRKPDGALETRGYEPPKPTMKPADPEPAKAEAAALGDGWIRHDGSRKCPIPNAEDGEYEVRWSDGSVDRSGQAVDWRWLYEADCSINLVAYRLIPTEAA